MTNEEAWNKFFSEAGEIEPHLLEFLKASQLREDKPPILEWSAVHLQESFTQAGKFNERVLGFRYGGGYIQYHFIRKNEVKAIIHAEIKEGFARKIEDYRIKRHINFIETIPAQSQLDEAGAKPERAQKEAYLMSGMIESATSSGKDTEGKHMPDDSIDIIPAVIVSFLD